MSQGLYGDADVQEGWGVSLMSHYAVVIFMPFLPSGNLLFIFGALLDSCLVLICKIVLVLVLIVMDTMPPFVVLL